MLRLKPLLTTVIGSYPSKPVNGDFLGAIKKAVDDQLEAGVDLISDGQVRYDMVTYFTTHIPGFTVKKGRSFITDRVKPPEEEPVTVKDVKWVKRYISGKAMLKGIVTGPITLVFSSRLTPSSPYHGYRDERLYMDVAEALAVEVEMLCKAGVDAIQIDEPFYSVGAPIDIAKKAVKVIANASNVWIALHVCGDVRRVFDRLLEFEGVDVLSHAFKGNPENLEVVTREKLENNGKKLGLGCIDTTKNVVETEEEVLSLLETAVERFSPENVIIHPDCGLRTLNLPIAKKKLEVMVNAVNKLKEVL